MEIYGWPLADDLAGVLALVVSTAVGLLTVLEKRQDRPRLVVRVEQTTKWEERKTPKGQPTEFTLWEVLVVRVSNVGRRPISIEAVGLTMRNTPNRLVLNNDLVAQLAPGGPSIH